MKLKNLKYLQRKELEKLVDSEDVFVIQTTGTLLLIINYITMFKLLKTRSRKICLQHFLKEASFIDCVSTDKTKKIRYKKQG